MLNWIAFAMAVRTDPEFIWTDVRVPGQILRPSDFLSRDLVPASRLRVVSTQELAPNTADANVAVSAVIRSDEPPRDVQMVLDFLRLPTPTQQLIEELRPSDQPRVAVLSNGHRILSHYPSGEATKATIHAISESGLTLIMTFADDRPQGRFAFDNVLEVDGCFSGGWRKASLAAEKWSSPGPFPIGSVVRLGDVRPLASVLSGPLG